MKPFDYAIAKHLAGATSTVSDGWTPKAGGIDLLDRLKERIDDTEKVVSVVGLKELSRLTVEDGHLVVGANLTLAQLALSDLVRKHLHGLAEAAGDAATPQVRARATLAGNLLQRPRCEYFRQAELSCLKRGADHCGAAAGDNETHALFGAGKCSAVHASNLAPVLVAAGASVVVAGTKHRREIPAGKLAVYDDSNLGRESALRPGEVMVEARVPLGVTGSAWREARRRQSFDWPLAGCAVVQRGSAWGVAFGGVAPVPWLAKSVAAALERGGDVGAALDAMLATAVPPKTGRYRLKLLRQVALDTIAAVQKQGAK